jgi:hypothetical protein
MKRNPGKYFYVESELSLDLSSTELRKKSKTEESLNKFFSEEMKEVHNHIRNYFLWSQKKWQIGNFLIEMDMNSTSLTEIFLSNHSISNPILSHKSSMFENFLDFSINVDQQD